jgi:Uma2 family endonuclease
MPAAAAISVDEYLNTVYRPDCDYIDGKLLERNVGEWDHGRPQMLLSRYLCDRETEWATVVVIEQRVQVKPNRFRVPDITAVAAPASGTPIVHEPPLLCVEILSRDDRIQEMQERIEDYLAFGVPCVWVIDPKTRRCKAECSDALRASNMSWGVDPGRLRGFSEDWRGVFPATALVFFARTAGARGRARDLGGARTRFAIRTQFGGLGRRGFRRMRLWFAIRTQGGVLGEDGVELFEEFGRWLCEEVEVGNGVGRRYTIRSQFRRPSGLEAAELVDASVEDAGGAGAGALDGAAEFVGGVVEVGKAGVGGVAVAETPGGGGDLGDEGFFEEAGGVELGPHGLAEVGVDEALSWFYVVGLGVEAEGQVVA